MDSKILAASPGDAAAPSPPRRGRRRPVVDHLLLRPLSARPGRTMQDAVYDQLRDALMIGAFRPGEALSTRALAESLGTSTMPVKDALRRLAAEGVVLAQPQSGFVIATLGATRFLDIIEARVRLETLVAARAAARRDDALVERLRDLNDDYRAASAADLARGTLLKTNFDFHFAIYGASGMLDVCEIILAAWLRIGPLFSLIEAELDQQEDFARHARIIDGLATGNGDQAAAALEADIRGSAARIAPLLPA